jgi:hypothetical protein
VSLEEKADWSAVCVVRLLVSASLGWTSFVPQKKKNLFNFHLMNGAMMKSVQMLACPRPDNTAWLKTILNRRW